VLAAAQALDLSVLAEHGLFAGFDAACFAEGSLNTFMGLGREAWDETRAVATRLLDAGEGELRDNAALREQALLPLPGLQVHMPAKIGDYTDFYSSREHATNVGIMFRGADNALQPNWLHLPVGYHGRASSIVVSGTEVRRPAGQVQPDPEQPPLHAPTKMLDFELEMAFFVGPGTEMGEPISMENADDHIFGMCLMNDWSARDIQKWEYVPLGPFGAKNFATTISPWVVPMAALEPFRCATSAVEQVEPAPLPYLADPSYGSYDIGLEVTLQSEQMDEPHVISRSNFRHLYWSIRQQLVHHSVTGCNMNPGDLLGSGTISGDNEGSYGSMLELAWMGTKPLEMPTGEMRASIQDGDTLGMNAVCERDDVPFKVGFGECNGRILPHTA
jgi:fumarylacetoacetase